VTRAIAGEVATESIATALKSSAVEVEPFRKAVGVDHRLMAGCIDQLQDPFKHSRQKSCPILCDMQLRLFDQGTSRRHQRVRDANTLGNGEGIAVATTGGQDHLHAGSTSLADRCDSPRRDIVL
jgi:hypothetical protein